MTGVILHFGPIPRASPAKPAQPEKKRKKKQPTLLPPWKKRTPVQNGIESETRWDPPPNISRKKRQRKKRNDWFPEDSTIRKRNIKAREKTIHGKIMQ